MNAKKFTEKERSDAKLGGFKAKKPKKPTGKITEVKYNNYIRKYNVWIDKLKAAAKKGKVKSDAKAKNQQLKNKLSGL